MFFEDFNIGDENRFGDYLVTEEEIKSFAESYDPQYFHLDDEAAKKSLFGGLCASGWHTSAMFMRMLIDSLPEEHGSLGSPGVDKLRWIKPVYPGFRLSVTGRVLEARLLDSKPGVGMVKMAYAIINQHNDTVMTLESNAFFRCRPKS